MRRIELIHHFAMEYFHLYANPNIKENRLKSDFAERCADLGFKNDNGKSFIEKYSEEAFHKSESLKLIIETVDDVDLLGSTILSHWYYVTSIPYISLISQGNRIWFLLAFSRLGRITDKAQDGTDPENDPDFKKGNYEYLICNEYNETVFNKLCEALEESIPNLRKGELLVDIDDSMIQIYYLGLNELTVYNSCDYYDEVYIKSEFDLDDFFDGNAQLILKRKAGCLYDENLVFGMKDHKNTQTSLLESCFMKHVRIVGIHGITHTGYVDTYLPPQDNDGQEGIGISTGYWFNECDIRHIEIIE